jgi:hypothetical protein
VDERGRLDKTPRALAACAASGQQLEDIRRSVRVVRTSALRQTATASPSSTRPASPGHRIEIFGVKKRA